jgi:hypothetical protein
MRSTRTRSCRHSHVSMPLPYGVVSNTVAAWTAYQLRPYRSINLRSRMRCHLKPTSMIEVHIKSRRKWSDQQGSGRRLIFKAPIRYRQVLPSPQSCPRGDPRKASAKTTLGKSYLPFYFCSSYSQDICMKLLTILGLPFEEV